MPEDWQKHQIEAPTVISVWFEKKKGHDVKVIIASPVYGPHASLIHDALQSIDIPCDIVNHEDDLLYELVRKNVYILTSNIAGLAVDGTVGELWTDHQTFATQVANEVIDIQEYLTGRTLPRDRLISGMVEAFDADPDHKCKGRSAPVRLARALKLAAEADIETPELSIIQQKYC